MVNASDVAIAAHKLFCEDNLIPRGLREPHDFLKHIDTGGLYAQALNDAELSPNNDEIAQAILVTSGWDQDKPETWRHPNPNDVVEYLRERS